MYSDEVSHRSRAALNTLVQQRDSFLLFFPATSHPDDFPIKVKYRNTYTSERWLWCSHARPSPRALCLCGFPLRRWLAPLSERIHRSALPTSQVGQTSSQSSWPVRRTSAHENTVCSQESGGPLVHGSFFLPVSFGCKMRSGSAVKSVIFMLYGRTLLCFNGSQRLKVKIAKLFVLFVCSTLKSAEEENRSKRLEDQVQLYYQFRAFYHFRNGIHPPWSHLVHKICSNLFV